MLTAVMAGAASQEVGNVYELNTQAAIAADLPGLPGYVLHGEAFWGQDRIDALRAALISGRAPYVPD